MLAPSKCGLRSTAISREQHCRGSAAVAGKEFLRQGGFPTCGAIVIRHRRCAVKRENGVCGRSVSPSRNRRSNAYGLLYVPAGSVVGALAPAAL